VENPVLDLANSIREALLGVNYQTWIGVVVLAFVAWRKFNTWTEKEEDFGKASPPRHFTTWARYVSYAFFYTLIIETVYIVLVTTPEILNVLAEFLKDPQLKALSERTNTGSLPLWVLVFLVAVVPELPGLRTTEIMLRQTLHDDAFIPAEARALVQQFLVKPSCFQPHQDRASEVAKELREQLPQAQDFSNPDNRIEHRWFKLAYLRKGIDEWKGKRVVSRFFSACRKDYATCEDLYGQLKTDIRIYSDKKAVMTDREYLERLSASIAETLDRLLVRTYEFISCGVLATEKMHNRRMESFAQFGLYPYYRPGIPIMLDSIIKTTFFVLVSTLLVTTVFLLHQGKSFHHSIALSVIWSVVFILMQGFCIFGAVLLYRRLSMSQRLGKQATGDTFVIGPIAHASFGFIMGFFIGFVIVLLNAKVFLLAGGTWSEVVAKVWPWALIPATTSGFIVYYLSSVKKERNRWFDAVFLGVSSALIAAIATALIPLSPGSGSSAPFMVYSVVTCGLAGLGIGFIFPAEYQSRVAALYHGNERRAQRRFPAILETILKIGKEEYPCKTEDLSAVGAKLAVDVPHEIGTKALFNIAGLGELQGRLVRKTGTSTCIQFIAGEGLHARLEAFMQREGFAYPH